MLLLSAFYSASSLFLSFFRLSFSSYQCWPPRLFGFASHRITTLFGRIGGCQTTPTAFVAEQHCAERGSGGAMYVIGQQRYQSSNHNLEADHSFITPHFCANVKTSYRMQMWGGSLICV